MTSNSSRRDPAWEHGHPIPGNKNGSICKYCGVEMKSGGVTRLKFHLIGLDPGSNVRKCESIPPEVRSYIVSSMKNKQAEKGKKAQRIDQIRAELRGESYENVDDSSEEEDNYPDDMGPEERHDLRRAMKESKQAQWDREHLHKIPNKGQSSGADTRRSQSFREIPPRAPLAPNLSKSSKSRQKSLKNLLSGGSIKATMSRLISKFFIYENIPASKADSPHFKNMVIGCQDAGRGVQPPTSYEIRHKYLDEEFKDITDYVGKMKAQWETYGCTIMCDGWTGPTRLSIINFMVYSKGTTVFLKSIDSSGDKKDYKYIYKLLKSVIQEVGEHNVVQVVSDNATNYVKAGKKLMQNHNVYWNSCAAHCIDLMFEEMGKKQNVRDVIHKGKTISNYLYNHNILLVKMREVCKGEIVRAAPTRFATNFISLESLLKKKAGLKQLFTSDWWTTSNFSKTKQGQTVESFVLDSYFWSQVQNVCDVSEPLYKVLRVVDTEVYPTMGAVYELMRVLREQLEAKHNAKWVVKIIDDRWFKTLRHDLHATGYYFNPRYNYRQGVGDDPKLIEAVHNVFQKLDPHCPTIGDFGKELTYFKDSKLSFSMPAAIASKGKMSPVDWWVMYGTSAPTVRKLAIKVLSQTASASACERNWSTFALIHTKQRNRLGYERLEKLVFCYYNMKLQLRDKEASYDNVDAKDPLDVFDVGVEFDGEERDQLYQWIRPLHLDDEDQNPSERIAAAARDEGINVERVIQEEVIGDNDEIDSFDAARNRDNIQPRPTSRASHTSNSSLARRSSSGTRSGSSSSPTRGGDRGVHDMTITGGGSRNDDYSERQPIYFTNEENFTHATQDSNHGDRRAGHGYRGGGNYSPRYRDERSLSRIQEDSLSTDFSSMGIEYGNHQPYKQGQNTTLPYPSYYLPYGMPSSDSSWSNSDVGSQGPIHDPYGWHVSQYMQNFMGDQTFDEYYNYNSTLATENDEENSENFEPHRRSTWF